MNINKLEIKYLSANEIAPYTRNSRTHSKEQLEKLKRSIVEFGMNTPIGIRNGVIVYGHARFEALKQLGHTEFPTVDLSHLSEEQTKAYVIGDNRLALDAGWDSEMLELEMQDLYSSGFDLELTGFSMDELLDMDINLILDDEDKKPEVDESLADEVPEAEDNPVIKLGDLIELGHNYQHRLLCGDSTKEEDVAKLMNGQKADMVFTDPPYGIKYEPKDEKKTQIKNDDVFLDGWIPLVEKYSEGFVFMWTSYQVVGKWLNITIPKLGEITNMVIWHKPGGGLGDLYKRFATDFELCLVWNRGASLQDKRIGSVWQVAKHNTSQYVHPTQKPVELMEKGIFNCSKTRSIVMDLFLGSGSTLIACENLSRFCYGMELDEKYAQVIVQRYVDYTSNPMIKINGVEVDWYEYKDKHSNQ